MICFHPVLTSCGVGTENTPPHGQGILIHWALDLILKEVDKEADKLAKPKSSFHCPSNWSWDSLQNFSLRLQPVVLIEILMNAGEILRNVKLIFSRCVGCSKGGSNFSQRVLRQHGTSASGPPAVPN